MFVERGKGGAGNGISLPSGDLGPGKSTGKRDLTTQRNGRKGLETTLGHGPVDEWTESDNDNNRPITGSLKKRTVESEPLSLLDGLTV